MVVDRMLWSSGTADWSVSWGGWSVYLQKSPPVMFAIPQHDTSTQTPSSTRKSQPDSKHTSSFTTAATPPDKSDTGAYTSSTPPDTHCGRYACKA